MVEQTLKIAAVVLAAGQSRRMGEPKLVLPWGKTSVIGQVVQQLLAGGAAPVVVVTGKHHDLIVSALAGLPAQIVINQEYQQDDMAHSLQVGLAALPPDCQAALVALGDQPQLQAGLVRQVLQAYIDGAAELVVPSFQQRRGHPWLLARSLWPAVQALQPGQTLRQLLQAHASRIHYLVVDTPTVLSDLDTPEDYARQRPGD